MTNSQQWFQNSVFPANLNDSTNFHIPKNDKPLTLRDLRPISFCNVIYKIMAKVIANRLKPLLDSIISPAQSAFVPDHFSTDNVMMAFEIYSSHETENS